MLGLEDAYLFGSPFTWSNGCVCTKLDRILINVDWHSRNLRCLVEFLSFNTLSDHTLTIVSIIPHEAAKNKLFKFRNMWINHPSFNYIILDVLKMVFLGMKHYSFYMKLKALKSLLKSLNRKHFSYSSGRARMAQENYSVAQNLLLLSPHSDDLRAIVKVERAKANFLLEAEW